MLLLSREDIKKVITMQDMIEADKTAFKMTVDRTVQTPLRTVIDGKYDGAFLFMPAYASELDTAALKVIDIFPHNVDEGKMTSPAQIMLIDGRNGYVIALLDGTYVTTILPAQSSDECIEDADLIITVTPSAKPVFDASKVKAGATISCVGTYEPHKHEMDPAILPRAAKIICDSKEAALSETGDLLIPIKEGIITEEDISGSLGDVINGTLKGRENDEEIIVYETVGVAAQDLVASKVIYDKAVAAGIGTEWK